MTHIITATYEGTSLVLDTALPLLLHSRVKIIIEDIPAKQDKDWLASLEQAIKVNQELDEQARASGVQLKSGVEELSESRR